jgi:hypothetical protein
LNLIELAKSGFPTARFSLAEIALLDFISRGEEVLANELPLPK